MKRTHYIVQMSEREALDDKPALTLAQARRLHKELSGLHGHTDGWGRRFPRIIKVTTEHKTITTNRR